ncbi:hypothetical protein G6O69_00955 [Pseudenhygromyxa sp. WMMC2535]|uniref:hypothetical protein n=1 Tax=Pseudenhygromyxa sp. WMMC2535 TaxID=2712867 RepID=UPI0015531C6F|nr:hypothetical protein [Pseudenhygromyxa sp. WMMC2535]NVB36379.1 hypothetical protein [Pseudenhygromyxa sp. WMMC2535]
MQTDKQLVPDIAALLGVPFVAANWSGVDAVLPILEKMKVEGAVVVFKFDGERGLEDNGAYTAIASGPPLGEDFLRVDAGTLEEALAYVIVRYAAKRWGYVRPS